MIKKLIPLIFISLIFSCSQSRNINHIDGKWELYKSNFILSEPQIAHPKLDDNLYFSGGRKKIENNDIYEYGSIKTTVNVEKDEIYTLYISGIISSCKIWVDNKLIGEYGEIGNTLNSSYPEIKRALLNFTSSSNTADIVIEFSNFHFKSKFLFKWIVYGKSSDVMNLYLKNQSKDYMTTGLLFICSVLFMLIFFIDFRNKYNLYFSLFTLSYGIRSYLMKNTTIESLIPWFNWVITFQFNKASELWALTSVLMFFVALYPKNFNNKISKTVAGLALFVSFLAFLPLDLFNKYNVLTIMHILILISGSYIICTLIKSVIHKCYLAKWTLVTITMFFASIVFDIFADRTILLFDYYSAQVVILVVVVMFFVIAKKRSQSSNYVTVKENLNSNIRRVFSMFVPIEILSNLKNENMDDRPPGDFSIEAVTMIFIDIRNFTNLSEGLTPEENFAMINQFYEVVGTHVKENRGYIESYGGDGVKAIFPEEPNDALNAAYHISDVVITSGIIIGLSIHFGKVVLGTIGGGNRIQATAISDVTRILGNMDQFNSKMGIEMLITEKVYTLSSIPKESIIYLGNIILKNEETPINLYQVIPKHYIIDKDFIDAFQNGVKEIQRKKYSRAYGYFQLALKFKTNDPLTNIYLIELEKFFKLRELTFTLKI